MLIEKTVNSITELFQLLGKYQYSRAWIFRGQQNYSWKLIPKIGRTNFREKLNQISEIDLFESWKRYALHYLDKEPINNFDWLTLAQHYGLVTRLLDWTKNPLSALYFLTEYNDKCDAALFCIEVLKSDSDLPDNPFACDKFIIFLPKGLSARIISQRSIFTISNNPHIPLEDALNRKIHKIKIPGVLIPPLKEHLDFYGVNIFSIYQDLDSISKYLNEFLLSSSDGQIILDNRPFG
jgi:hypothetical protein